MKCYSIKAQQSVKSRKPWSEGIAQALSAACHDLCVATGGGRA